MLLIKLSHFYGKINMVIKNQLKPPISVLKITAGHFPEFYMNFQPVIQVTETISAQFTALSHNYIVFEVKRL